MNYELVKAWDKEAVACFEFLVSSVEGGGRPQRVSRRVPTEYQSGALLLAPIFPVADFFKMLIYLVHSSSYLLFKTIYGADLKTLLVK